MKSYEKMAKCVLEARDEYYRKKKIQQAKIKKYAPVASGFCLVLLLGLGVWRYMSSATPIPNQTMDGSVMTTKKIKPTEKTDMTEKNTEGSIEQDTTVEQFISEPITAESAPTEPVLLLPSETTTNTVASVDTSSSSVDNGYHNTAPKETTSSSAVDGCTNTDYNPLPWDEMTINQQYNMAEFGEPLKFYMTAEKEVPKNVIGDYICTAYMSGYDYYTETYYHCITNAYKIIGEDDDSIAIRFDDDDNFYLYIIPEPEEDTGLTG